MLKSPITVHIEVTDACNERCRHCYNFDRGEHYKAQSITWEHMDYLINELKTHQVMHAILTGGEPMLEMEKTCYLAKHLTDAGLSVSLNSNLTLVTKENVRKLKNAGIDHCLTTLHSHKERIHNQIAGVNAFKKIINGIQTAQDMFLRVTVNTILNEYNKNDIYAIGKFVRSIGVNKFLVNRTIPSPTNNCSSGKEFIVDVNMARKMVGDLLRLKAEGMEIGTCRMLPECFFADLEDCDEFVGRGCSAGKRHMLVSVNGETHACVHEAKSWGNIYQWGLQRCWENMREWHNYIPVECMKCPRLDTCEGGCRMVGLYHTGEMEGMDNLALYWQKPNLYSRPKQVKMREEDDFYIFRQQGAKVSFIEK